MGGGALGHCQKTRRELGQPTKVLEMIAEAGAMGIIHDLAVYLSDEVTHRRGSTR